MVDSKDKIDALLQSSPRVINLGLENFAQDLNEQVTVIHVNWTPPAGGNQELATLLAKLGV